jgi:hypothetical protein
MACGLAHVGTDVDLAPCDGNHPAISMPARGCDTLAGLRHGGLAPVSSGRRAALFQSDWHAAAGRWVYSRHQPRRLEELSLWLEPGGVRRSALPRLAVWCSKEPRVGSQKFHIPVVCRASTFPDVRVTFAKRLTRRRVGPAWPSLRRVDPRPIERALKPAWRYQKTPRNQRRSAFEITAVFQPAKPGQQERNPTRCRSIDQAQLACVGRFAPRHGRHIRRPRPRLHRRSALPAGLSVLLVTAPEPFLGRTGTETTQKAFCGRAGISPDPAGVRT